MSSVRPNEDPETEPSACLGATTTIGICCPPALNHAGSPPTRTEASTAPQSDAPHGPQENTPVDEVSIAYPTSPISQSAVQQVRIRGGTAIAAARGKSTLGSIP